MPSFLTTAPDNVLDAIFVHCDYAELFASSHVCTAWRRRTGNSVMWRRVAQSDMDRARGVEYQIVATPVQKRAGLSSSFNTAHLYRVEVRTRHRQRDQQESVSSGYGGYGGSAAPSYAQNLQMYTFGASSNSAIATSVTRAYGGGGGGGELERNPSSTCFTTQGSTTKVRRICMRYIQPLRFTAGDRVAAALLRANQTSPASSSADGSDSSSDDAESEREQRLPLWEDGSIVRPGVLVCDPRDPCSFCFYAATLRRPWCTVLMDKFVIDDAVLIDFIERSRDGGSGGGGGGAAAACIDLAFRVEELSVVRNDPRDPSHLVKPTQPVSIRIGVIEESQLGAYQRGLQHVLSAMTFYSPADAAENHSDDSDDAAARADSDDFVVGNAGASAQDYAWGALDSATNYYSKRAGGAEGGVSWSYTGGGGPVLRDDEDLNSAAAAEAEVSAWLQASVQAETRGTASAAPTATQPTQFWSQTPQVPPTTRAANPYATATTGYDGGYGASTSGSYPRRTRATDAAVPEDDHDDSAYVLGDTPGSFGYDTEGGYISEASSYPLGAPLQNGDIVHLQFFHDEDVIVVTRNRERLGTLVADAFSEHQRWCVAVSLQNCGVRFIPPRLN